MKLGELLDLIEEANQASDAVIATEENLNKERYDATFFNRQARFLSAKAYLAMLRDRDIV